MNTLAVIAMVLFMGGFFSGMALLGLGMLFEELSPRWMAVPFFSTLIGAAVLVTLVLTGAMK